MSQEHIFSFREKECFVLWLIITHSRCHDYQWQERIWEKNKHKLLPNNWKALQRQQKMCICHFSIALVLKVRIPCVSSLIDYYRKLTNHHKCKNVLFITSRFFEAQDSCVMSNIYLFTLADTYIRTFANVQVQEWKLFLNLFVRKYKYSL